MSFFLYFHSEYSSWHLLLKDLDLLIFSSFLLGSIPLDPSLARSLEEGQAFIDLFPNSPTLNAVNTITSKLLLLESSGDQ